MCDHAKKTCPFFLEGEKFLHKGFVDASEFEDTEDEILAEVRRVRDEIKVWIEKTFGEDS